MTQTELRKLIREEISKLKEQDEDHITSEKEFRDYAMNYLKEVHGDEFDKTKAKKLIDGLVDEVNNDEYSWSEAVGVLQNSA